MTKLQIPPDTARLALRLLDIEPRETFTARRRLTKHQCEVLAERLGFEDPEDVRAAALALRSRVLTREDLAALEHPEYEEKWELVRSDENAAVRTLFAELRTYRHDLASQTAAGTRLMYRRRIVQLETELRRRHAVAEV